MFERVRTMISEKSMGTREILKNKLQFMIPTLPKGEKAAAIFIIKHLDKIGLMNLSVIAREAGCSGATIVRLCKRLGFNGFHEFRNSLRNVSLNNNYYDADEDRSGQIELFKKLMQDVISSNMDTMSSTFSLISDQYKAAGDVLLNAQKVYMIGNGDAIIPCEMFSLKMMKIGKQCTCYSDQDLQIFAAGTVSAGDVVVCVSHTGRSRSVVSAARIAYEQGAAVIGITATLKSPLQRYCTYTLNVVTKDSSVTKDIVSRRIGEQLVLETLYLYYNSHSDDSTQSNKRKSASVIYQQKMEDGDDAPSEVTIDD